MAWAARENINIIIRMRSFQCFHEHELNNLKDALLMSYEHLVNEANMAIARRNSGISTSNIAEMSRKTVEASTTNIRLEYIGGYLTWLAKDKLNHLTKAEKDQIEPEIERQHQWFRDNQFIACKSCPGNPLTKKQKEILEEILKPDSAIIVWDEAVRFRNRLIVRLYWETGVRKTELMCFRLNDAPGDRTITLRKIPNNPDDPRKDKGKVKTLARTINISASLDQNIQDYILEYRQPPDRKRVRHKFIFTSNTGKPISVSAIDNIFSKIRNISILDNISPHDLRHDFATDLRKRFAAQGLKDEVAEDYLRGVFGWSPKSKMPAHYTRQLHAEIVRQMAEERQERLEK